MNARSVEPDLDSIVTEAGVEILAVESADLPDESYYRAELTSLREAALRLEEPDIT